MLQGQQLVAANNLRTYLESEIFKSLLSKPLIDEYEPSYTARVLFPLVQEALFSQVSIENIQLLGDGGNKQSFAHSFLGLSFHPDISISQGKAKYWCAEVKLVKGSLTSDVLSKALGQALMYKQTIETVSIILLMPGSKRTSEIIHFQPWLNILLITDFLG